jgi:hypothetical protein
MDIDDGPCASDSFPKGWLAQEMKSASEEVAAWPEWKRRSCDGWWERLRASQQNAPTNAGPYYSNFPE